jgi:hypothetical protein
VASSTAKKVIVRRFDRESLFGFVNPFSYLQPHAVEVLKPDGTLAIVPYAEVKSVAFVKDFEGDPTGRPIFLTRPKLEGLWVRMVFQDGEVMDGILPNNLLNWDIAGFTVTPPEPDGNNQKIFVPRQALRGIQVLGVVGSPLRGKRKKTKVDGGEQPSLF